MAGLTVTWLGTASLRLETPEVNVLIDPYIQISGGEHPNSVDTFLGADHILITHGHLDHLASLPAILSRYSPAVHCTPFPAGLLEGDLGHLDNLVPTHPGDRFSMGDIEVAVYPGRHIKFDAPLVAKTLNPLHLARYPQNFFPLLRQNHHYQEKGETVFYELRVQGLRLQIMGSLALQEGVDYPAGADVLFLPYQGNTHLTEAARPILRRLAPKAVIATHFDSGFPPVSQTIPTGSLIRLIEGEFPGMEVRIPVYAQPMELIPESSGSGL